MLKKAKGEKAPKPEKFKPEKGTKAKGDRPEYFWEAWKKKRQANKTAFKRESSIPAKPTSKEDKIKLIVAAAIFVLVPIMFFILSKISTARKEAATKAEASRRR